MKSLSRVQLFVTPWAVAHQAPLSMEFFRQEYWSGLPFPSPGDIPDPSIKPRSPALQADALPLEPPGKPNVVYTILPLVYQIGKLRLEEILWLVRSSTELKLGFNPGHSPPPLPGIICFTSCFCQVSDLVTLCSTVAFCSQTQPSAPCCCIDLIRGLRNACARDDLADG